MVKEYQMEINNYFFERTCNACPEQYEVYNKQGKHLAYIHLRWGYLYAVCPDIGGTVVYEADIGDGYTGCFDSNIDREIHLNRIANAIEKFYNE